jgi:hypothetical protein
VYSTPLRDKFFDFPKGVEDRKRVINGVVNNTVYHLEAPAESAHLFSRVLGMWERVIPYLWLEYYDAPVAGFETFIEPNLTLHDGRGSGYRATGWQSLGRTKGAAKTHPKEYGLGKKDVEIILKDGTVTTKRTSTRTYGKTTPKDVLCKWRSGISQLIPIDYKSTWDAVSSTPEGRVKQELAKQRTIRRKAYQGKLVWASSKTVTVKGGASTQTIVLSQYETIRRLQLNLTTDLLKPKWRKHAEGKHQTYGHCYVMTESLYHLFAGSRGYSPHVVRVKTPEGSTTHWWLQNKSGDIIDGTKEQFETRGIIIPYSDGRGSGFLTKKPSKRCNQLIAFLNKPNLGVQIRMFDKEEEFYTSLGI